jgi:hypothetical protein
VANPDPAFRRPIRAGRWPFPSVQLRARPSEKMASGSRVLPGATPGRQGPCARPARTYLPAVMREKPPVQVAQVPVGIGNVNRGQHRPPSFRPVIGRWDRFRLRPYRSRCIPARAPQGSYDNAWTWGAIVGLESDICCRRNPDRIGTATKSSAFARTGGWLSPRLRGNRASRLPYSSRDQISRPTSGRRHRAANSIASSSVLKSQPRDFKPSESSATTA